MKRVISLRVDDRTIAALAIVYMNERGLKIKSISELLRYILEEVRDKECTHTPRLELEEAYGIVQDCFGAGKVSHKELSLAASRTRLPRNRGYKEDDNISNELKDLLDQLGENQKNTYLRGLEEGAFSEEMVITGAKKLLEEKNPREELDEKPSDEMSKEELMRRREKKDREELERMKSEMAKPPE